jgi:cobaltochelatase CobT
VTKEYSVKATKVEILRESVSKVVPILSGRGIRVTQIGMKAYVQYSPKTKKPELVNIPFVPDNAGDDLIVAVQGFIDHEVAHVLYSDATYIEAANKAKVAALAGILEDTFIERKMKKAFAGSKTNLIQTWQFVQDKLIAPRVELIGKTGSPEELFGVVLVPLMRFWSGQKECGPFITPHLPALKPFIDAIGQDLIDMIPQIASSKDSFTLAVAMHNRLEELRERRQKEREEQEERSPPSKDEDDSSGPSDDSDESGEPGTPGDKDDSSPEDSSDSTDSTDDDGAESKEEDDAEDGESSSTSGSQDEMSDEDGGKSDSPSRDDGESNPDKDLDALKKAFEEATDLDKMMDSIIEDEMGKTIRHSQYTPLTKDFDKVADFKAASSEVSRAMHLERMEDAVRSHLAPLQRHMERCISAKSHSRYIPGYRSGKINPTALHRIVTGDERLFRRKVISKTKDAAISLVVDLSGSMTGHKVHLAMQTAFAMSSSLDRLNITHEVIGFTTSSIPITGVEGRRVKSAIEEMVKIKTPSRMEPIYMPIFKSFNSRLTIDRKQAMACFHEIDLRNNIDGESVEYAARRLAGRTESRKIMIVLSDGQPWGGPGDINEQCWHLKNTVKRLVEAGIEVFGIGIMDRSVSEYYPNYAILNDLEDLPKTVMMELERLLLSQRSAA